MANTKLYRPDHPTKSHDNTGVRLRASHHPPCFHEILGQGPITAERRLR
jgi:hypothetical protein